MKDTLNEMFDYPAWSAVEFLESVHCTIVTGTRTVKRGWAERLFTRPWQPWVSTKIEVIYAPDPNIYEIGCGVFTGHPATIAKVRKMVGQ